MTSLFGNQVTIPLPGETNLLAGSRFAQRYQGNISYLKHLLEHSGEFMLGAFSSRQYSPGKLLERVWDGEYAGKWLDAATRTALGSQDQDFIRSVDEFAAELRGYQQSNGFMGELLPTDRDTTGWEVGWNIWNQWTCMIGLLTHFELTGESKSLECAARICDWIIQSYSPIDNDHADFLRQGIGYTNVAVINQIMRLYRHTGNEDLCRFVDSVIQNMHPLRKMLETGQPDLIHPYMLGAALTGMVDLAVVRSDEKMFDTLVSVWRQLVTDHLFPTGSLGESEDLYEGPLVDNPDGKLQETCATTEWIFLTQRLYELTGKAEFAEALEKTTYNALLGAQSDDGMKWCYWTPLRYSKHFFHGPTRCCFWSGPRGISRIPSMIYASRDNEVFVNFFDSSSAALNTPGGIVEVKQDSQFPVAGSTRVELVTPDNWTGVVRIRVPEWSENFTVKLNRQDEPVLLSDGYAAIAIKGANNYSIEVNFDILLSLCLLSGDDYALQRGPEVLSIDLRDNEDTWLGKNELVSIPEHVSLKSVNQIDPWPGFKKTPERRRYRIDLNDARTTELRQFVLTPYGR